ncbi:MAG: sigma-70 family RNA polymerase sigma factor [Alphaproteobacteria bacterium]|nr:sigma-70 family RNA polymerase sigma factor [Alphaproteobacteria bacterium]
MNKYDGIDKCIVDNVRAFAKRLSAKLAFLSLDDFQQELMLAVFKSLQNFSHDISFDHFIRKVLARKSSNLLKYFRRHKEIHSLQYNDNLEIICSDFHFDRMIFIHFLPSKFKLICKLAPNHSAAEIAEILSISRSQIYADLQLLSTFVRSHESSRLDYVSFIGRKFKMKNLSTIETMNTKELSSLEVFDLADLSDQVAKLLSHAKELKEKLDDALNLRFSETVKENLRLENKDTGTTKFIENGFQIIAEVPKKVTWDSQKIEEIIKTIPESHRRDYIKTTYSIDERRYANFSYEYQQLFKPARTVTPGKTKFQIKLPEEA